MAKNFGLLNSKESFTQMASRYTRAREFGSQVHIQNLQDQKNKEIKEGKEEGTQENPYTFLQK